MYINCIIQSRTTSSLLSKYIFELVNENNTFWYTSFTSKSKRIVCYIATENF